VKECQSVEKTLAFGGVAVLGPPEVAVEEARPFGELQIGEDSAIVFCSPGTVSLKRPHKGKTRARGRSTSINPG
jgi:hypothetical protein